MTLDETIENARVSTKSVVTGLCLSFGAGLLRDSVPVETGLTAGIGFTGMFAGLSLIGDNLRYERPINVRPQLAAAIAVAATASYSAGYLLSRYF